MTSRKPLSQITNDNYCMVVFEIKSLVDIPGRDRIVSLPIFGHNAVVQKKWNVGDLAIFIPAESQLSQEYAHNNDLHRHDNLNKTPGVKGYLEDNRRVKAIKLGSVRSDAMVMPLSSLDWTGYDTSKLTVGDYFESLNGHELIKKYERPVSHNVSRAKNAPRKVKSRVDSVFMPEHISTSNYWRMKDYISPSADVVVTQKLHGTSIRVANTFVRRKLSVIERIARRCGASVQEFEFANVYGSRRVVKDANDPNQNHFYDTDIWTHYGRTLDGLIPEGFVLYGELIGWTPDMSPIQSNYTYNLPTGNAELYVYRVSHINAQGRQTDLSWDQLELFCREIGVKHVPVLWKGKHEDFDVDNFIDKKFYQMGYFHAVPLSNTTDTVDEGVCVRVEGLLPSIYKAKSPVFLQHETKVIDQQAEDLETGS